MRFFFRQPGDSEDEDEGIDYQDADEAFRAASEAALAMASDRAENLEELTLEVSTEDGSIGSVTVTDYLAHLIYMPVRCRGHSRKPKPMLTDDLVRLSRCALPIGPSSNRRRPFCVRSRLGRGRAILERLFARGYCLLNALQEPLHVWNSVPTQACR